MAKELPYFKFEPNQWENGNIQICTREDKGLFMDLCSMYWSRLGDLPLKLAVQKLCAGNATAFDSLIEENIFAVIDGFICIGFLNEQLADFKNTSKQNSKNAKDGWDKRRKNKEVIQVNAVASNPHSETNAIREDKSKENKIKKEKNINNILLSEIKISDDSDLIFFKDEKIDISEKEKQYLKTAIAFQKLFIKNLKEKNSPTKNQEQAKFKNYVTPIRLMIESDGVDSDQIREAYKYLNSIEGEFWKKNILSTESLRKNIQKIIINKNTQSNGNQSQQQYPGKKRKQFHFSVDGLEKAIAAKAKRRLSKMESDNTGTKGEFD